MKNIFITSILALTFMACAQSPKQTETTTAAEAIATPVAPTKAQAVLKAANGSKIKGIIHFSEDGGKMKIETMVEGLKPGPHGFHLHETGDCSKADFSSAGGHFNPAHSTHGAPGANGHHAGDFGNLMANNKGKAATSLTVEGLTMKPGADSIIGKAVIIHQDKDDLKSQPAGNSGPRIACGVIEAL
ncbi:MAG: superoxide dismutase family protein [Bdellovibrio sp.]|nr:superoxide dismutase family protein [Bdellovibrio sp.]